MSIQLNDTFIRDSVTKEALEQMVPALESAYEKLMHGTGRGADYLGWLNLPESYDRDEFDEIKKAAHYIQKNCDIFIVIGIGGSYLGARAAIEFIKSPNYNQLHKNTPNIYFSGNDLSSSSLQELLTLCEGKDVCVNVISKSGTTTEPAIAFRIFRNLLEKKYGEEGAKERIFVTTDKAKGKLKELADQKGYKTFVVPDDIGGRYSVLSAVGLLPIAAAGIDIDAIMAGANEARKQYATCDLWQNDCCRYAVLRNILYRQGKEIEILVSYDSAMQKLSEWWKQLFGESEGKEGKGLFPVSVTFSTDLHSLGQMIQQGKRNLFETVLVFNDRQKIEIPFDEQDPDGLNFLAGKTMDFVNEKAFHATAMAHADGDVPNIILKFEGRSAYNFGFIVYFFELACALSAYMLDVNPFDQPGVEAYKDNMYALLGKPGYEEKKQELEARMKNR
ncbi:MAG: glucose-6-phosphate isomerase [Clostridiales bacterium]|nr:glucose-6-phosphate isomerase [Clostridiales bacterium]